MLAWFRSDEGKWFKQELAEDGEDDATAMKGMEAPLRRQAQVVAYLAGKDANITFGTDTPSSPTYGNLPGLNGFLELHRLHAAGMSLAQVFKAATINNARTFKLDAQLGTIEVGKSANLLLMRARRWRISPPTTASSRCGSAASRSRARSWRRRNSGAAGLSACARTRGRPRRRAAGRRAASSRSSRPGIP